MRKVIGIGETVLDIIFKKGQPIGAYPGGSTFNGIISLGRSGIHTTFISEAGNDRVGRYVIGFLKENGVNADNVNVVNGTKIVLSWMITMTQSISSIRTILMINWTSFIQILQRMTL